MRAGSDETEGRGVHCTTPTQTLAGALSHALCRSASASTARCSASSTSRNVSSSFEHCSNASNHPVFVTVWGGGVGFN